MDLVIVALMLMGFLVLAFGISLVTYGTKKKFLIVSYAGLFLVIVSTAVLAALTPVGDGVRSATDKVTATVQTSR